MNIKKFIQIFHGTKMIWEIRNDVLYIAANQMMVAVPVEKIPILELEMVKQYVAHSPGEVYALYQKHNGLDAQHKGGCETAFETGLHFHVTTPNRELSILKVEHEGRKSTATLVRTDFLRILGKFPEFMFYNGQKRPLSVGCNGCIAYIMPEQINDIAWANLLDIASALCRTTREVFQP